MLDFNWKTCLKEAGVVADGKSETLTTSDSTRIFKQVNQQRDNMEQAKGNQASKSQAAEYTQAAMKAMVESGGEPARGFGASVTKSHHAAGSLYAFTFSEFLEGLIIAAIECANGTNPPPREGLSKAAVLTAVRRLLEERVLLRCQRGDVLDFRYTMANSAPLGDALDSIRHLIDPLYDKYADMPTKVRTHWLKPSTSRLGHHARTHHPASSSLCHHARTLHPPTSRLDPPNLDLLHTRLAASSTAHLAFAPRLPPAADRSV